MMIGGGGGAVDDGDYGGGWRTALVTGGQNQLTFFLIGTRIFV